MKKREGHLGITCRKKGVCSSQILLNPSSFHHFARKQWFVLLEFLVPLFPCSKEREGYAKLIVAEHRKPIHGETPQPPLAINGLNMARYICLIKGESQSLSEHLCLANTSFSNDNIKVCPFYYSPSSLSSPCQ